MASPCRSTSLNCNGPMIGWQLPALPWLAPPSRSRNLHRLVIFPQLDTHTLRLLVLSAGPARVIRRREGTVATTLLFRVVLSALVVLVGATPTLALVIYPVDRADILAGSRFDFKVEFDGVVTAADAKITVNGDDGAAVLGRALTLVPREPGVEASALIARDVVLTKPGRYTVVATDGKQVRTVTWQVFSTGPRQA